MRQGEYLVTDHVRDEMDEDGCTLYDLEQGILSGTNVERQRGRMTQEAKYRIQGMARECELCGAYSARIRHVNRTLGKGEEMILVEHIPLVVCRNCGQSYLTAATLHHLEQLRCTRETRTTSRPIPVASFDAESPHRH